MPTPPPGSELARHWTLDPATCFLNHGSFGACPREVLAAQSRVREQMESEPVRFFVEEFESLVDAARRSLAAFLHCDWRDLAPMPNATNAVATIVENFADSGRLAPGDEILTNDHEYPACQNNLRRAAARAGARIVVAPVPFPCPSPDAAADAILSHATKRTRLALISHVTSPTGLVFPVERVVRELEGSGIATLVDGAHAPGMVPTLDLTTLGASFYTANCHKWICSPKGSAFLYVRKDYQEGDAPIRPLVLSNNAEKPKPGRSQFLTEFDYIGTNDYSAFFTIPDAIRCMGAMQPGGWPGVMQANHDLCLAGRDIICRELGITPTAPDGMVGSICTMILPSHDEARRQRLAQRPSRYHDAIQDAILKKHRIQVPFWGLAAKPERFLRISAQLYNSLDQYKYLAAAVREELAIESRL
ncbi:MAG: aminotransferase class V-fold PLP-dependent enzyme [Planctomycetes bacterium]|nr:aminotransferase class V-fold PLP-dependent enzyme [Planctomycetota bacterium]